MNPNDAFKLLETYTLWLNKRWGLPDYEPVTPLIRNFLDKERSAEIKPEAHIALLCPHVAQDTTLVRYAFPLGDHSLRVCRACYDSIQGNILEDVVKDSLKSMFGTWMMKDHKPFIG